MPSYCSLEHNLRKSRVSPSKVDRALHLENDAVATLPVRSGLRCTIRLCDGLCPPPRCRDLLFGEDLFHPEVTLEVSGLSCL